MTCPSTTRGTLSGTSGEEATLSVTRSRCSWHQYASRMARPSPNLDGGHRWTSHWKVRVLTRVQRTRCQLRGEGQQVRYTRRRGVDPFSSCFVARAGSPTRGFVVVVVVFYLLPVRLRSRLVLREIVQPKLELRSDGICERNFARDHREPDAAGFAV